MELDQRRREARLINIQRTSTGGVLEALKSPLDSSGRVSRAASRNGGQDVVEVDEKAVRWRDQAEGEEERGSFYSHEVTSASGPFIKRPLWNSLGPDWMAERVDGGKIPTNCSRIVSKATPHVDAEFPAWERKSIRAQKHTYYSWKLTLSTHTKPFGTVPTARTAFMHCDRETQ